MEKHANDKQGTVAHAASIYELRCDREMATIGGRPAMIAGNLSSINGVYVQCRLPNGEDVFVSLREILILFKQELKVTDLPI